MNAPSNVLLWLRFPTYGLYHIASLAESAAGGYPYDIVPTFRERFTPAEQQQIVSALEWAIAHPDLDWTDVLPNLPSSAFNRSHCELTRARIGELSP
jgi:hypothetical protein